MAQNKNEFVAEGGKSNIVGFWAAIFKCVKFISIFQWAYRAVNGKFIGDGIGENSPWIEGYVHTQLVIAALIFALTPQLTEIPYNAQGGPLQGAVAFLTFYGAVRVFELTIYLIDVVLFEPHRCEAKGQTYEIDNAPRSIILLFCNFAEVILWFAAAYIAYPQHFGPMNNELFSNGMFSQSIGNLYGSFTVTTNIGQAGILPKTDCGAIVLWVQSVVGVVLILIGLARFLNILPIPAKNNPRRQRKTPVERKLTSRRRNKSSTTS